ncbi:hypothetical protein GIB67_042696 [Kingdonia uniflora]|uniref:Ribosomal eL28/Mak16 domain-containing protein n=1 Tax=Kingdonia uniflora TaxID=39325 RepID=A0A7J7NE51_9MAGN|nr:hypothetical protein GIB67_042696 [Kingdonia uniflora]
MAEFEKSKIQQQDDDIWQIIGNNYCTFRDKEVNGNKLCRNPYNVTGKCNRKSCPLANSRYATIKKDDAITIQLGSIINSFRNLLFVYKNYRKGSYANKIMGRVKLPGNYEKALVIINKHLMYWPKFSLLKTKQRLMNMTQMRKHALKKRVKAARPLPKEVLQEINNFKIWDKAVNDPEEEKESEKALKWFLLNEGISINKAINKGNGYAVRNDEEAGDMEDFGGLAVDHGEYFGIVESFIS